MLTKGKTARCVSMSPHAFGCLLLRISMLVRTHVLALLPQDNRQFIQFARGQKQKLADATAHLEEAQRRSDGSPHVPLFKAIASSAREAAFYVMQWCILLFVLCCARSKLCFRLCALGAGVPAGLHLEPPEHYGRCRRARGATSRLLRTPRSCGGSRPTSLVGCLICAHLGVTRVGDCALHIWCSLHAALWIVLF